MQYILILDKIIGAVMGLLNVIGATQKVSDIIAARIKEGRTEWTDAERKVITDELNAAQADADAKITAAGG